VGFMWKFLFWMKSESHCYRYRVQVAAIERKIAMIKRACAQA
jgi:hypothetical protein